MRTLASQVRHNSFGALLTLVLISLTLSACPNKKPKYPDCSSDKDCKDKQHCYMKQCSECSEDSHCRSFESCDMGACILKDGMCNTSKDCTAGQVCKAHKCSACESDGECGPNASCNQGACLERGACKVDEDCADDEDCIGGSCQRVGRNAAPEISCKLGSVYFGFDEFSIPEDSKTGLQETSVCIQQGNSQGVLVEGFTDDQGTVEYNIALSEKRARSVADFLSRLGIDPMRLRVIPKGETEATGTDDDSRSEERRVDLEWK